MATISPHSSWTGTLGSGYSDGGGSGVAEPSDPARTSFKPILALDTVPDQRVSGTLEITAVAFCKGGIDSVDFYLEGTKVSVTTQSLNSTTGVYGYTITIDVSGESNDGPMKLFIEAVPTSGSAQNRVIGAYTFNCNANGTLANTGTVYYCDWSSDIAVDGAISGGPFTYAETLTQATTGATALYISDTGSTVKVGFVTGTPNSTNVWTGGDSGASFTPSSAPTLVGGTSGTATGTSADPFTHPGEATAYWKANVGGGSATANISGVVIKCRNATVFSTATLNANDGPLIIEPDDGYETILLRRSNGSARIIVENCLIRNFTWDAVTGTDDIVLGNLTSSPLDLWIDNCTWNFNSKVMPDTTSIQSVRFTNCTTNNHGYLFHDTVQLIRGCTAVQPDEDDVFSRAKWVMNCTVTGIDDPVGGNHADIWQLEGITADVENYLLYNVVVTDSDSVQPIHWAEVMTDCACVNYVIQRTGTTASVFGNIQGNWDHVLMWNCSWSNYEPSFRADVTWDYTSSSNGEIRQCAFKGIDTQSVTEANVLTAVDVVDCNLPDGSFSGGTNISTVAEATAFAAPTTAGVAGMRPTSSMPTATRVVPVDAKNGIRPLTTPIGGLLAALTITNVSPATVAVGATVDLTVTTTGAQDGVVASSTDAGFTVNSETWVSATEVTVNVTGVTAGTYTNDLVLTNPDGQTATGTIEVTTGAGSQTAASLFLITTIGKRKIFFNNL